MRDPIVNLSDKAVLESPRLTESITKAWLSRMIDAGWMMLFREPGMLFKHSDEPVKISQSQAKRLLTVYWRLLLIPSPYNLDETLSTPLVKFREAALIRKVI